VRAEVVTAAAQITVPGLRDIGLAPSTRVLRLPAKSSGDDCTSNDGQARGAFNPEQSTPSMQPGDRRE
jgi:hypothetical protein